MNFALETLLTLINTSVDKSGYVVIKNRLSLRCTCKYVSVTFNGTSSGVWRTKLNG